MKQLRFPVFMLETETDDIRLIYDTQSLKIIIEEFFDILQNDFKFWDLDGHELIFGKEFLEAGKFDVCNHPSSQAVKMRLRAFLEKNDQNVLR